MAMPILINHQRGDVLTAPPYFVLAHAISEDLHMGAGIAKVLQAKFRLRTQIALQDCRVGKAVFAFSKGRIVFNLITKRRYFGKPSYSDISVALYDLKAQMLSRQIYYLAIPEICCGLDGKDLNIIIQMLTDIFTGSGIQMSMYHL